MVWHDPRHDILANQSMTHVITWIRRPPEQETDITEAIPSTNDKWALESTQQKKAEVGWAHRVVGRPPWSADQPMGPTDLSQTRGGSPLDANVGSWR